MVEIKIFQNEIKDGIADKIVGNSKSSVFSTIALCKPFDIKPEFLQANKVQENNLHYMDSILVTTGWNNNTDVWLPEEVWPTRKTCINKQFNFEHDPTNIIGHTISSYILDADLSKIDESSIKAVDDTPIFFHVANQDVIYKYEKAHGEEIEERITNLVQEIKDGEWYVSTEALFPHFDYAIMDGDEQQIITRNAKTSSLSKHLKFYGGDGTYQGSPIGRVLRNITFCGKGVVKKPGNNSSVFLSTSNKKFVPTVYFNYITKQKKLEDNKVADKLESVISTIDADKINKLEKTIQSLRDENDKLKNNISEKNVEGLTKANEKLQEELKVVSQERDTFKATAEELNGLKEITEKQKTELEDLHKKLVEANLVNLENRRVNVVTPLFNEQTKAAEFVKNTLSLKDEEFDKQVAIVKSFLSTNDSKDKTDEPQDDPSKVLDSLKPADQSDLSLAASSTTDSTNTIRKQIHNFFKKESDNKGDK